MGCRRFLGPLLSTTLIVAAGAVLQAQSPPREADCYDQLVATVTLRVTGHPDYPQSLLAGLDLKPQSTFTRAVYRRSVERLVSLAGFENVTVLCSAGPGGVNVVFEAVPRHRVTQLRFVGNTELTPQELDEHIRRRYNGLPNVPQEFVRQEVLSTLSDNGYRTATVEVTRTTSTNPDSATLSFQIEAGPLARIGAAVINNSNQAAISDKRIETITGLVNGRPFRPGPIRDALLEIVRQLKSKGYYTATVIGPSTRESGKDTFDVSVNLDPGPLVTLEWDAAGDPPPAVDLDSFVPIKQENQVDQDLLDDSKQRLQNYLKNEGYADALVQIIRVEESPARVTLKVRLTFGPRYRIDRIEFPPNLHATRKELDTWLQVRDGAVRDQAKIQQGLLRIAAGYRQLGYYDVKVTPDVVEAANRPQTVKEKWVVLRPQIIEGPKGRIVEVQFERTTALVAEGDLRSVIQGKVGLPYQVALDVADRLTLEALYLNLGYRMAKVDVGRRLNNADPTQIVRVFKIEEGPQIHVADIQIVGWRDITEQAIREEMVLHPGSPFGENLRLESQRRLYNMGVFSQASVDAEPLRPGETAVHVIVRVDEAPDTTVSFGGGLQVERKCRSAVGGGCDYRIEAAPRGLFQISRRNLGGRNRLVSLFTRLSLRPRDVPEDPVLDGRGYVPSEYRAALTYQERRAFGTDTDWLFGVASEQAIRSTFNFRRQGGNVDFQRLLSLYTRASARYAIDVTKLYDVRSGLDLEIDRAFPQVRLSTFTLSVLTDLRNDSISPTRGSFQAAEAQIAARAIGSEVGYVKLSLQATRYRTVINSKADSAGRTRPISVLALRANVGFARGFEREVTVTEPDGTTRTERVAEIPASQRYFAGGSTTVRGFLLDQLGTPAVLTPAGFSKGGNGLMIFNAELRTQVARIFGRRFSTALFADSGNVFAKVSDMSLRQLRGSVGFGIRYDSPLGPLRLDFGRKLSRMTFLGQRESAWEFNLSFGEIF